MGDVHQGWESSSPGGTRVLIGLPPVGRPIELDLFGLVAFGDGRRLIASRYGSAHIFDDFSRMVDQYLAGVLHIDELMTRRYSIEQANKGLLRAGHGRKYARAHRF